MIDIRIIALSWLSKRLCSIQLRIDKKLSQLSRKLEYAEILKEVEEFSRSTEDFLKLPAEVAETAVRAEYKEIVNLYFILKQAAAMFESYQKELPLQIYNEMRNALDHLMRSAVTYGIGAEPYLDHEKGHLKKMRAHLQRALLDSMKLTCALLDGDIKQRHTRYSERALGTVSNGDYIKQMTARHVAAVGKFVDARAEEFLLGTEGGDKKVFDLYLKAVIAHKSAHDFQSENYSNLEWAKYRTAIHVAVGGFLTFVAMVIADVYHITIVEWTLTSLKTLRTNVLGF